MTKKDYIDCECGFRVTGNSKLHAESNLKIHKKSKLHKKLIDVKKEQKNEQHTKHNS